VSARKKGPRYLAHWGYIVKGRGDDGPLRYFEVPELVRLLNMGERARAEVKRLKAEVKRLKEGHHHTCRCASCYCVHCREPLTAPHKRGCPHGRT